ncbi:MAG: hypothetical protein ABFS34_01300 [Gemmatimonadota bacterium]
MATVEYIAILVSIVVGLAMAEVLQGFADSLRHRASVRSYWPVWTVAALILVMAIWMLRWVWLAEDQESWNWGELALALAPGALIFIMARLAFPQELEGRDLRAYYFEHSRVIWSLAGLFVALAVVRAATLEAGVAEGETSPQALVLRLGALLLCVVLALSGRPRVHEIGLALAILLMIARIATSFAAFGA